MSLLTSPLVRRMRGRSRTGLIGIDIGSQSLKIAQLEYVAGRRQIAAASIIPIPDGRIDGPRHEWLASTLREETTRRNGFRGREAACMLSMTVTESRTLNIPPGTQRERSEMISQELAENATDSAENPAFDFWNAWPVPGDTGSSANVLSISGDLAAEVADAIYRSGLDCSTMDGGPFPLARAAVMVADYSTEPKPIAILDWGHRAVHFAVIVGGQPAFSRLFKDCGVTFLAAALGKSLDLTLEESQQLLSTSGFPHPKPEIAPANDLQALVADAASEPFHKLQAELEKTLNYLRSQREELVPSQIWLAGGGATIRHAAMRIEAVNRIPVNVWKLPTRAALPASQPVELLAQAAALSELAWVS